MDPYFKIFSGEFKKIKCQFKLFIIINDYFYRKLYFTYILKANLLKFIKKTLRWLKYVLLN